MSVGQEFWIVAAGCQKTQSAQAASSEKDEMLGELKRQPALAARGGGRTGSEQGPWNFQVPDGDRSLQFGSFDNLIRLTDDLQKYDQQVDSILHRLERQYLELDPKAEFKVKSQRMERPFMDYLKNWQWDEAKYPKTRSILDNLTLLMSVVNKLDEEARNKTAQYNEFKTQRGNLQKKEGATLPSKDLVDVLTPDKVTMKGNSEDDFIATDHITTIPVIIPRGYEAEFLDCYETMVEMVKPQGKDISFYPVVPGSAKKFADMDDKEGNTIWRVVVFRKQEEEFKKACREKRYIVRDFEYSEEAYKKLKAQRETLEESVKRQHELVRGLYQAAWSDAMVAWIHIKAMRVFVESVLRFGMPPRFAAFVLSPKPGAAALTRKALADVLGKSGQVGPFSDKTMEKVADDDEEYFPYVSFSFTPFTVPRG